jgi:hypothetical protein
VEILEERVYLSATAQEHPLASHVIALHASAAEIRHAEHALLRAHRPPKHAHTIGRVKHSPHHSLHPIAKPTGGTQFPVVRRLPLRHVSLAHRSLIAGDDHDGGDFGPVPIVSNYNPKSDVAGNFVGVGNTGWNPPDDNLAVSSTEVVEAVNEKLGFWDKSGNPINVSGQNTIGLTTIFTGATGGLGVFDPRITFDPANGGHFILVGLEQGNSPQVSNLDIAISTNASPQPTASSWRVYRTPGGVSYQGTNYWLDFPGLGFDDTAIYVTGNLFTFSSNNFLGARLMTFDKNAMETATGSGGAPANITPAHSEIITDGGSLQPAVSQTTGAPEYMIEDWDTTHVRVHTVTNPLSSTAYSRTTTLVTVPTYAVNVPDAPQQGSSALVATNDTRMINAVFSNGSL